jgi:hypothetical protein
MAYLCLFTLYVFSVFLYEIGRLAGRWGNRRAWLTRGLGFFGLVLFTFISRFPEYEYHLLFFPGYIYFRGAMYLPFAALFVGSSRAYLPFRTERAILVLLIILSVIAGYDFRWGIPKPRFSQIATHLDRWGICRHGLPEMEGAASCVTLLHYYGLDVTEGWMAEATLTRPFSNTDAVGICRGLEEAFQNSDFRVTVERLTWEELQQRPEPMILIMNSVKIGGSNFLPGGSLVCFGGKDDNLLMASPIRGLFYSTWDNLQFRWSGIAVVVYPPLYSRPGTGPWVEI